MKEIIKQSVLVSNQKPSQIADTLRRSFKDKSTNFNIPMPTLSQIQTNVKNVRATLGASLNSVGQLRSYISNSLVRKIIIILIDMFVNIILILCCIFK